MIVWVLDPSDATETMFPCHPLSNIANAPKIEIKHLEAGLKKPLASALSGFC